jgi:hypothetical protein
VPKFVFAALSRTQSPSRSADLTTDRSQWFPIGIQSGHRERAPTRRFVAARPRSGASQHVQPNDLRPQPCRCLPVALLAVGRASTASKFSGCWRVGPSPSSTSTRSASHTRHVAHLHTELFDAVTPGAVRAHGRLRLGTTHQSAGIAKATLCPRASGRSRRECRNHARKRNSVSGSAGDWITLKRARPRRAWRSSLLWRRSSGLDGGSRSSSQAAVSRGSSCPPGSTGFVREHGLECAVAVRQTSSVWASSWPGTRAVPSRLFAMRPPPSRSAVLTIRCRELRSRRGCVRTHCVQT